MVFVAPPARENADGAGCSHCGRNFSRTWRRAVNGSTTTWFCAGTESKSMCREKARRAGASIWDPSQSGPLQRNSSTNEGTTVKCCHSGRLAQLIRLAWQQDDPERLAQVLALVQEAGMSLSEFPTFRHEPDLQPLALPPAMSAIAERPDFMGFGSTTRAGREKKVFVSRAFEAVLGVTADALERTLDAPAFFATFCQPDDLAALQAAVMPAYARKAALSKQATEAHAQANSVQTENRSGTTSPATPPNEEGGSTPFPLAHQFQTEAYPLRTRHIRHHGSSSQPYQPCMLYISFAVGTDGSEASLYVFSHLLPQQATKKRAHDGTQAQEAPTVVDKPMPPADCAPTYASAAEPADGKVDDVELEQDLEQHLAEILSSDPEGHFRFDELMQLDPTLLQV